MTTGRRRKRWKKRFAAGTRRAAPNVLRTAQPFLRRHFIQKLLVVNFALVYAVAQYMTVSIATNLLHDSDYGGAYSLPTFLCYLVSAAVYLPPMGLMMRRTVKKYLKSMEARLVWRRGRPRHRCEKEKAGMIAG